MNFIDLNLNKYGKSYYKLINVCNISLSINVYFCARATLGIFMGFKLCSHGNFMGD